VTDHRTWVVSDSVIGVDQNQQLVLWNEFAGNDSPHISLPSIIRHDRKRFRDAILRVLDEVAAFHVDGKPVIKALEIEDGLSYLHMTLVWAKRWGELGVLPDAVKTLALAERLRAERPSHVDIRLVNRNAVRAIAGTCRRLGISCSAVAAIRTSRAPSIRALRHLARWFTFSTPSTDVTDFVIADYLFRVDPQDLAKSTFRSGYWANLPEVIEQSGKSITWLHRFTPHPSIPSPSAARVALRNLPRHHLLDQVCGLRDAWRAWRTYRQIGRLKVDARNAFVSHDCDLWPIFERDWNDSFHGSHPMSIAINLVNLQRLLPKHAKRTALYIYENQPWEFAFRHVAGNDTQTIAVPHATVRFWDLRYFVGQASRNLLPERVAVNSGIARDELLRGGYDSSTLRDAEALMYLGHKNQVDKSAHRQGILVLGELEVASTQRYLDWVVTLAGERKITFKPHPLIDAEAFAFDRTRVRLASDSADQLIAESEVVVLGASGTATLEAIARNTPVIAVLNPHELDLSVVGSHPLLRHVATREELARALRDEPARSESSGDVFFLDSLLPRWKQLLELG
jgi:surface carbohydrate biosynthesis protein (TIGR04326 family)